MQLYAIVCDSMQQIFNIMLWYAIVGSDMKWYATIRRKSIATALSLDTILAFEAARLKLRTFKPTFSKISASFLV
jgi:hypothetical protein